jgi:hypothetical protein
MLENISSQSALSSFASFLLSFPPARFSPLHFPFKPLDEALDWSSHRLDRLASRAPHRFRQKDIGKRFVLSLHSSQEGDGEVSECGIDSHQPSELLTGPS